MSGVQSLALYASAILTGALVGGAIPLVGAVERSDALLSFSAGVMLGSALFHMLPEAAEGACASPGSGERPRRSASRRPSRPAPAAAAPVLRLGVIGALCGVSG